MADDFFPLRDTESKRDIHTNIVGPEWKKGEGEGYGRGEGSIDEMTRDDHSIGRTSDQMRGRGKGRVCKLDSIEANQSTNTDISPAVEQLEEERRGDNLNINNQ